jgi:HTH-type transcriptional regulator/antitoxin HigA
MNWTIISNEKEHKRALERLEEIFDSNPQDSTFKEAELLSMLIEKYENETEEPYDDADPIEYLKSKLNKYDLKRKDLALVLGGISMASEILN